MNTAPHISALKDANPLFSGYDDGILRFENPQEALTFACWVASGGGLVCLPAEEDRYSLLEPGVNQAGRVAALEPTSVARRTFIKPIALTKHGGITHGTEESYFRKQYIRNFKSILDRGLAPDQVVLWDLSPYWKPTSGWQAPWENEHFWEYLAGCYLRRCGYVVSRWHPHMGGFGAMEPDLCAYYLPEVNETLRSHHIDAGGCFDLELSLLPSFNPDNA